MNLEDRVRWLEHLAFVMIVTVLACPVIAAICVLAMYLWK